MSPADTARGVCARHRGMPVLSRCVTCGANLCAQCIVRTPVGFKCARCTGGSPEPASRTGKPKASRGKPKASRGKPKASRGKPKASRAGSTRREDRSPDDDPRSRRRVVVAAVVAVVGAVALIAYLVGRPESTRVGTASSTTATSTPASVDVPLQFAGADGHQLSGDLLLPARTTHPVPGVVIVPDWGAVNRNGMAPVDALPDPLYGDLANLLASHGIASLRYDPAGQGQSTIAEGSTLKLSDLVGDAAAAVGILTQRIEVDRKQITVVGDGWGGLLALQLAAQDNVISRLVLVSTPGRPVVESLADELQADAVTPADGQLEVTQLQQAVSGLVAGGSLPDPSTLETPLRPILQSSQAGFLRSMFGLDPTALARAVHVPTLVVRGGADPGISAQDSQLLAAALGPTSQLYLAGDASATLTLTTRTVVATPSATTTTTIAGVPGGNPRAAGNVVVTISRDDSALTAVARWALGLPISAGDPTTTTTSSGG